MRVRALTCAAFAVLALPLASCGNDDAEAVTHDGFMRAVCEKASSNEGPLDQFFRDHPNPELSDWVEGLPGAIQAVTSFYDAIASTPHPKEDDAKVEAALAAIDTVRQDWERSLQLAEKGDQPAFDALEAKAQDTDIPAMFAALAAVDGRDCAELTS